LKGLWQIVFTRKGRGYTTILEFEGVEDINLPVLDIDEVNRLSKDFLKGE
jgi:hypothetical protein